MTQDHGYDERLPRKVWIERAMRGDRSAYDVVVSIYAPLVLRLLRLRLGDEGAAERLARSVFVELFDVLPRLDHPLGFLALLLRRTHRALAAVGAAKEVFLEDWEDGKVDAAPRFAELSELHQEVLRLRYVHGLSYAEIARALEIDVDAVSLALRRIKAHLRLGTPGSVES